MNSFVDSIKKAMIRAIHWMFVFLTKFVCWKLIPKGRAFGKWLGYECRTLKNGISVLKRGFRIASFLSLREDVVKRWLSMNQELGSHQIPNLLALWSLNSQSPKPWEISFHLYYSTSLCITQPVLFCWSSPKITRMVNGKFLNQWTCLTVKLL